MELVDEKLDKLELRIERQEKHIDAVNKLLAEDILIFANIASDFNRNIGLRNLDSYFRGIKQREKAIGQSKRNLFGVESTEVMDAVIQLAEKNQVPFERLAPYMIQKLGRELTRRLVKRETMLQHYGQEGFKIWQTLLK